MCIRDSLGTKILVPRSWILVPRSWYQDLGTRILIPGSWYQDLGTRILVPRSWYQDLRTKILVARTQRSLKWNKRCSWKFGPRTFRLYGSAQFFEANNFRKNGLPTNKDLFSGNLEVQIYEFRDFYLFKSHGIWSEMGPYGSLWAHIKTGRSPMARDHFQTPPDPKMGYKNTKMNPKTRTSLIKGFHKRLPNSE